MSTRVLEAIVIGRRALGEADLLCTLMSRTEGKVRAVARGGRRSRSKLAGGVLEFTHGSYQLWRGASLDGISQCQITSSFAGLRADLDRTMCAGYMCRATELLTSEGDPSEPFFLLLLTCLSLAEVLDPRLVGRFFTIRALGVTGFRPQLDACAACGGPVPAEGPLALSPALGGILCAACPGGGYATGRLGQPALAALRRLQAIHPRRLPGAEFAPGALAEAGAGLRLLLEHVVDRPVRGWFIGRGRVPGRGDRHERGR